MKKTIGIIVLVVVVAIVAGGFVYLLTRDSGGKTDIIVNVEDIKRIAQLATVEYHISTYLFREKGKKIYEWLSAKFFVFVKGKVKGSVDLDQAVIEVSPDPKNRMVKITFKKGAVLVSDPEIAPEDIKIITCANPNIFHKISDADRNRAVKDVIALLKKTAIDDGIMNKTKAQAKLVLATFLQPLGYASQIEFEDK